MCPEIRSHPKKKVINIGTTAQTEKSLTNTVNGFSPQFP